MKEIDMDQIKKALSSRYRQSDMEMLGFDLLFQDADDYYFMKKDNSLIVFLSGINCKFYTYPIANNMDLKEKK